jgi:tRNA (guanine-N7-)-methyltransferase
MRLRRLPWVKEAIQQYAAYLPQVGASGNWQGEFEHLQPLQVEIGVGRGRFLCGLAAANPHINYIGIEAQLDVLYFAAKKVANQQLSNVRLLEFDANHITTIFRPGEIERLYINFCDPWPKNRHAKRRLTHRLLLAQYRHVLQPGGELFFKTDNEDLFAFSLKEFQETGLVIRNSTRDLHNQELTDNIMTEYEARFSAKGIKICRCEVVFAQVAGLGAALPQD